MEEIEHNIPDWKEYFMNMLPGIASRSKDKHTKIGCVIIDADHTFVSSGYNSFPRGINDKVKERLERPEKYKWMVHADTNAIYAAARKGVALKGCTMFLSGIPCNNCAMAIIQVGILEVIYDADHQEKWEKTATTYNEEFERTKKMLQESGVVLTPYRHADNKI